MCFTDGGALFDDCHLTTMVKRYELAPLLHLYTRTVVPVARAPAPTFVRAHTRAHALRARARALRVRAHALHAHALRVRARAPRV